MLRGRRDRWGSAASEVTSYRGFQIRPGRCCNAPELIRVKRRIWERSLWAAAFECRVCGVRRWALRPAAENLYASLTGWAPRLVAKLRRYLSLRREESPERTVERLDY